jgi:hypothetical protein
MSLTVRQWAVFSVLIAAGLLFSGGDFAPAAASATHSNSVAGSSPIVPAQLGSGNLPAFPSNLTHFIYIVRENHVFDDYLGDCHLDINASCDDNQAYDSPTLSSATTETAPSGDQLYTPYLHSLARNYTVFDNMYSSIDPYSSQAHAYLYTANTWGGSDSVCASGGTEGTGSSTEWGIYNGTATSDGLCSFGSDGNDQNYNSGNGSIFDRYLGPNVAQSASPIPFLTIGDMVWEIANPACTAPVTTGIPGSLPGNNIAIEHLTGCTNGWWYNSSSGSASMPPSVNTATGIPQELWVCMETSACSSSYPSPFLDQYAAYAFISYVADYGLPTYTYISLLDDHPGSLCGSSLPYTTCIQMNDASMNLIVEDIENATSPYRNNTVIAITEDDTQAGQNGRDHINDGRRFPFVLVAPHNVEKQGAATGAGCGISPGLHCGYVVHPTFNTSNVLAVMERVEMNVNPSSFALGPPTGRNTFPMVENDYLAEGNPLEPVWKCGETGVLCNTGVTPVTITSTAISPNPINAATNSAVGLTATAKDQNGAPIGSATYAWVLTPGSLGSLTAATGSSVTFNAGATAGNGHVCENATYLSKSVGICALVSVSATVSLASVAIAPSGKVDVLPSAYAHFQASSMGSNSQSLTALTVFNWTLNPTSLASLNKTTNTRWVNLTALSTTGNMTLCVNGTYKVTTILACDVVSVAKAAAVLSAIKLIPAVMTISTGGTQTIYGQPLDQYGNPYTSPLSYQWSLSSSALGSVNPVTGTGNTTLYTAGTNVTTGTLQVFVHTGSTSAYKTMNITVTSASSTLTGVGLSPTAPSVTALSATPFTATPACSATCPSSGITYTWTLSSATLGSVSGTGATVYFNAGTTAGTVGIFVNATLNGITKGAHTVITVTTTAATLSSVALNPTSPSVAAGGTQIFTATPSCSSTCPSTGISYSWSISSNVLGSLSGSGATDTFTALNTAGTVGVFVNATLNGVTKGTSTEITITSATLSSVSLSPTAPSVSTGGTKGFTATPACTPACPASGINYAWSLSSTSLGSLSGTGASVTFTAGNAALTGGIFVNATLGTTTAGTSTVITVTSASTPTLSQVTISPTVVNITTGGQEGFTASIECVIGVNSADCPSGASYSWTLSNSYGSVSPSSGTTPSTEFTAGSTAGTVVLTVTATLNGLAQSATATIYITSGPTSNGGLSSTLLVLIIVAAIAVVAVVAVALLLRRRGKEPAAAPAQPGSSQSGPFQPEQPQMSTGQGSPPAEYYEGP